jgi:hypothetical protein
VTDKEANHVLVFEHEKVEAPDMPFYEAICCGEEGLAKDWTRAGLETLSERCVLIDSDEPESCQLLGPRVTNDRACSPVS